jgi:hypothetical protein
MVELSVTWTISTPDTWGLRIGTKPRSAACAMAQS